MFVFFAIELHPHIFYFINENFEQKYPILLTLNFFLLENNLLLQFDQLLESLLKHSWAYFYFLRNVDWNGTFHYHVELSPYISVAKQLFIFSEFFQLHVHCYLDKVFLGLNPSLLEKLDPFENIS